MKYFIYLLVFAPNFVFAQVDTCKFNSVWMYRCWDKSSLKELKKPFLYGIEYYNEKGQRVTTIEFNEKGNLINTYVYYINNFGSKAGNVKFDSAGRKTYEMEKIYDSATKDFIQFSKSYEDHKCSAGWACRRDACGQ